MPRRRVFYFATAALLLGALPIVVAHGHGDESGEGSMEMNDAPQTQVQSSTGPESYWRLSEHAGLMYMHIVLEIVAWFIVLPVGVMLSIARSRLAVPIQSIFLLTNTLALCLGIVYRHKTPNLYENNAHDKIGWIVTWIASAWVFMALVQLYAGRAKAKSTEDKAAQPMTAANIAHHLHMNNLRSAHNLQFAEDERLSTDSGQGTERNTASLNGHSRSPSVEEWEEQQLLGPTQNFVDHEDESFGCGTEKHGFLPKKSVGRFFSRNVACFAAGRPLQYLRFFYVLLDRTLLVQGFVAFISGTVVYGGIGHGGAIFNVLAHFVKGGIFFGYGLLTLGRWMGAFADWGWAWNVKPSREVVGRRRAVIPSAEFTESFVIFLYGCTNVFLEHLAAWGGEWTAQDLEHVSISVMFFGGGLLGMLIESRELRELLNSSVVASQPPSEQKDESWEQPRQYKFSMNPVPGLIILLLGKMMSSHHQESMLSTMIHSQWGSMFMMFALARALTYVTLYISPPTSFIPSRPPTEIITAFCLIAGGLTFMVSNKDTVAALESYNLDAMFTFTVTMGLVCLIMSWTTVLIAIKGWAVRKESKSLLAKGAAGVLA